MKSSYLIKADGLNISGWSMRNENVDADQSYYYNVMSGSVFYRYQSISEGLFVSSLHQALLIAVGHSCAQHLLPHTLIDLCEFCRQLECFILYPVVDSLEKYDIVVPATEVRELPTDEFDIPL